jgi:T-complex protein 1 subunit alpha
MLEPLTVSVLHISKYVHIVLAVQALSNIVKSSLGPQGLDKMLVDDIGDVTITNDGATILKLLEVTHPAAKVLVELSQI